MDENKIDLALRANGGKEFNKGNCRCDPSVGMAPCEYCAIQEALLAAREVLPELLKSLESLLGDSDFKWLSAGSEIVGYMCLSCGCQHSLEDQPVPNENGQRCCPKKECPRNKARAVIAVAKARMKA